MKDGRLLEKSGWLSLTLAYVGAFSLFAMMCLTAADVVGRYVFNSPITGAFELTEFLVLILIFSFLAHSQAHKAHVTVDLILSRFPRRFRFIVELFNHLISLALMALIAWVSIKRAFELKAVAVASPNLGIPSYPFVFFLVLGCLVTCIEYARDIVRLLKGGKGDSTA